MFCTNCGGKVEDGVKFCPSCGKAASGTSNEPVVPIVQQSVSAVSQAQKPTADEKYCFSCGSVIKKIAEICPKCGVRQSIVQTESQTYLNKNWFAIISLISIVLWALTFIHYNATYLFGVPAFRGIPYWPDSFLFLFGITGSVFGGISIYKHKSLFSLLVTIISTILFLSVVIIEIYNASV
jgi:RNA polymerase subunit RPABC4/transcription elongation factor Spt4